MTLDYKGILAAILLGIGIFFFGKDQGLYFLALMLWFLLLSGVVTAIGKHRKQAMGVYEKYRSWNNVAANGVVPLFIAFLYYIAPSSLPASALILAYVASVAAITADKFSSEIGVLGVKPVMLMTLKHVRQGTSGGVTAFGIAAGILGSVLIGVTMAPMTNYGVLLVVVMVAGFVGNIIDSILGYFEEQGIGNKFSSNFLCSLAGGAVGLVLLLVI
ncbi:MAG: DUF92 domain-containing protein [Candidatus Micrarchaeota archaeon]|nr:DUF92 domain-containing protein [Candidatus Micrarchaeota archaeon]